MASEFPGGGFGDTPTNDPTQLMGKSAAPAVNGEGFDAKYLGDGAAAWAAPGTVTNVPTDKSKNPNVFESPKPGKSKGYAPGLG